MTSLPQRALPPLNRHREISEIRIRAGGGLAHLRFQNPGTTAINPARTQSVAATFLPAGDGKLARSLRRILCLVALRSGSILNFCRAFKAAGKPVRFHLASHVCQDLERKGTDHFHALQSAGSAGLVAAPNGHRSSEGKIGNVRKSSGEIRNVIC